MPVTYWDWLDDYAARYNMNRSEALRHLLRANMEEQPNAVTAETPAADPLVG